MNVLEFGIETHLLSICSDPFVISKDPSGLSVSFNSGSDEVYAKLKGFPSSFEKYIETH